MKIIINIILINLFFTFVVNMSLKSKVAQTFEVDVLKQDEILESSGQSYFLKMQGDGNLVAYSKGGKNGRNNDNPIWSSNTNGKGKGPYSLALQEDGNVVVYDSGRAALWNTGSNGKGVTPFRFIMQEDGNIVMYDKDNKVMWAAGTNGKK